MRQNESLKFEVPSKQATLFRRVLDIQVQRRERSWLGFNSYYIMALHVPVPWLLHSLRNIEFYIIVTYDLQIIFFKFASVFLYLDTYLDTLFGELECSEDKSM